MYKVRRSFVPLSSSNFFPYLLRSFTTSHIHSTSISASSSCSSTTTTYTTTTTAAAASSLNTPLDQTEKQQQQEHQPSTDHTQLTYASLEQEARKILTLQEQRTLRRLLAHPKACDPSLFVSETNAYGYSTKPMFSKREIGMLRKCALLLNLPPSSLGLPPVPPTKPLRTSLPKLTKHQREKPARLEKLRESLANMDNLLENWKEQKKIQKEKRRTMLPF